MRLYGLHIILILISIIHILYIHLEPNPPSNLSAVMTCDAKGYKVYTEWKVCYPNSKSTTVIKLSIYSRAAKDSYVGMTVRDKISSAGSSSCATWFSTDWVSPLLPHF